MTLLGQHPLEAYFGALEEAGLFVEALRETGIPEEALTDEASRRWHVRARRGTVGN